jgi:hypothetical protein
MHSLRQCVIFEIQQLTISASVVNKWLHIHVACDLYYLIVKHGWFTYIAYQMYKVIHHSNRRFLHTCESKFPGWYTHCITAQRLVTCATLSITFPKKLVVFIIAHTYISWWHIAHTYISWWHMYVPFVCWTIALAARTKSIMYG